MLLRWWQKSDAASLFELFQQNTDLKRQMPTLNTLAEAEEFLQRAYLPAEDHAVFCLEHAGEIVGCVSIQFTARQDNGAWDRGWVSYWSTSHVRGQGFMKIAVSRICDWVLGELGETTTGSLQDEILHHTPSPHLRRLELGYRTNNPASGKIAAAAGFTVEGIEREKFFYDGRTYDAVNAARLRQKSTSKSLNDDRKDSTFNDLRGRTALPFVHHVELWTANFAESLKQWSWLLESLGARQDSTWEQGVIWRGDDGAYIVLEQSSDVRGRLERCNPGMNHLALNVQNMEDLEELRKRAGENGWRELFTDQFPHASGPEHTALYLENFEGFEVELVVG